MIHGPYNVKLSSQFFPPVSVHLQLIKCRMCPNGTKFPYRVIEIHKVDLDENTIKLTTTFL